MFHGGMTELMAARRFARANDWPFAFGESGIFSRYDSRLDSMETIDMICDRFDEELRYGLRPTIESFIQGAVKELSQDLVRELIPIEVDFFRREGIPVRFSGYYRRFSDCSSLLDELARELAISPDELTCENPDAAPKANDSVLLLDRYYLLQPVGRGGFGTVWKAIDTRLRRDVAVKIPRPGKTTHTSMPTILREARIAARLQHPNIVTVFEVSDDESRPFIVSEFVDGESLELAIRISELTVLQIAELVRKISLAMHHAHEAGVVHGDLKPSNIIVDRRAEPRITDFGLAKHERIKDIPQAIPTAAGTPAFMAPEQFLGDRTATDRRTDIYGIGAVLYSLLSGSPPVAGGASTILRAYAEDRQSHKRLGLARMPARLAGICERCLAESPSDRYPSANELSADLGEFIAACQDDPSLGELAETETPPGPHQVFSPAEISTVDVRRGILSLFFEWWRLGPFSKQQSR